MNTITGLFSFIPDIHTVSDPLFIKKEIEVNILRLDLADTIAGGNKTYKLKGNIESFKKSGKDYILTFGGAWSNHIAATAKICRLLSISCKAIIRGEELNADSNITLTRCRNEGMQLEFVSRNEYRALCNDSPEILAKKFPDAWIIPEGGSNPEGAAGCMEIANSIPLNATHIILACGTGTTAAGIAAGAGPDKKIEAIAVVNDKTSIVSNINMLLDKISKPGNHAEIFVDDRFIYGGYGKTKPKLDSIIQKFKKGTGIDIELVYTGKMIAALYQLASENRFPPGSVIVAIHTGGLQYLEC